MPSWTGGGANGGDASTNVAEEEAAEAAEGADATAEGTSAAANEQRPSSPTSE